VRRSRKGKKTGQRKVQLLFPAIIEFGTTTQKNEEKITARERVTAADQEKKEKKDI